MRAVGAKRFFERRSDAPGLGISYVSNGTHALKTNEHHTKNPMALLLVLSN